MLRVSPLRLLYVPQRCRVALEPYVRRDSSQPRPAAIGPPRTYVAQIKNRDSSRGPHDVLTDAHVASDILRHYLNEWPELVHQRIRLFPDDFAGLEPGSPGAIGTAWPCFSAEFYYLAGQSYEFLFGIGTDTFQRWIPARPAGWVFVGAFAVADYVPAPLADPFRFVMSGHLLPSVISRYGAGPTLNRRTEMQNGNPESKLWARDQLTRPNTIHPNSPASATTANAL